MTQVVDGTWRFRAKRFVLPLVGGLVALGLVGCSSQTASVDPSPALTAPQIQPTKPIAFAPTIGAPAKKAPKLSEALVASAGEKHIPVVPSKDAEYTIRGYVSAKTDPKGTKFSCIWDITDKSGKRAKRFEVNDLIEGKKGGDAWDLVDEAAMQRMAAKTTDELLVWLPKEGAPGTASNVTAPGTQPTSVSSQPATTNNASITSLPGENTQPVPVKAQQRAEPKTTGTVLAAAQTDAAASGPAVAIVMPVTGAPGDGVNSLTSAMKRFLQQEGVKLTDASGANTYVVRGSVQLEKAANGQQPITIRWLVIGPDGKQMEKAVVQRNNVQEGSLDGPWGQVADLAAGEAAKSLAKLIGKPAG